MTNGFSLPEALAFLQKANGIKQIWLAVLLKHLRGGRLLAVSFAELGFSSDQVLQIELAESHGELAPTLKGLAKQMQLTQQQKENFLKAIAYPLVLLLFLLITLLSMRYFLLPQLLATGLLKKDNWAVTLVQTTPVILISLGLVLVSAFCLWKAQMGQRSLITRFSWLVQLPLIGTLQKDYHSAYFALEWGKLFDQGLELNQIVACILATQKPSLMKELAAELQINFQQGKELAPALQNYRFLRSEFSQIVLQGEASGQLGKELLTYSELIWRRFFTRLEFFCAWIQPLIFLLVALLIISLYVAMLLPLSNNLGGVL